MLDCTPCARNCSEYFADSSENYRRGVAVLKSYMRKLRLRNLRIGCPSNAVRFVSGYVWGRGGCLLRKASIKPEEVPWVEMNWGPEDVLMSQEKEKGHISILDPKTFNISQVTQDSYLRYRPYLPEWLLFSGFRFVPRPILLRARGCFISDRGL